VSSLVASFFIDERLYVYSCCSSHDDHVHDCALFSVSEEMPRLGYSETISSTAHEAVRPTPGPVEWAGVLKSVFAPDRSVH